MTPKQLIENVEIQFNIPEWRCSWEHPGYFYVYQDGGKYFFAGNAYSVEDGEQINEIRIDLYNYRGKCFQSWAIPFKGRITAKKIIKAFADCINILATEEIEGVTHDT